MTDSTVLTSIQRAKDELLGVQIEVQNTLADYQALRELLCIWLTGDCPNHSPECRETHLCQLCFENAVIDFDLERLPVPSNTGDDE